MNQQIHDELTCLSGGFYNGSYVGSGLCECNLNFLSLDLDFYCVFYYFPWSCFDFYFYSCFYSYFCPDFQIDGHGEDYNLESSCEDSLCVDNDDIPNVLHLIDDAQIGWEEDYSEYGPNCYGKHVHEEWDEEHEDSCFAVYHIRGKKDRWVGFEVMREADDL